MIREPPSGFKIQVEETLRGTAYSWKDEEGNSARFRRIIFHLLIVCAAVFFGLFVLSQLASGSKEAPSYFLWGMFVFCVLMALFNLSLIYSKLKGPKPFILTLSPGNIHYKVGTISESSINSELSNVKSLNEAIAICKKHRKRNLNIETSKIANLKLERVGEKQRLSFDYEADRIEIGETLTEPEREWLYEILKEHCGVG